MRLYIIRHGKAERQSHDGRDESRVLTGRGKRQAAWLAEHIGGAGAPTRVVSSPAVRAFQTAEEIAGCLGLHVELEDGIGLGAAPSDVIDLVAGLPAGASVALVGHNPTLSVASSILLCGLGRADELDLRTGEAAVLDLHDPAAPVAGAVLERLIRMPKEK
jgi:phosphohistidine phosphatase